MKKWLGVLLCVVMLVTFCACREETGLLAASDIEQKLNEAYIEAMDGAADDYEGVSEFTLKNVKEETHDQTFHCFVLPSKDDVMGFRVMGLVKNGQIIQIQSSYTGFEDEFHQMDSEIQMIFQLLPVFPAGIFKKELDSINKFGGFIDSMEVVNDGSSGAFKTKLVDGDLEYTYMGGTGNGGVMSIFTVRYLPAFSNGFFEDETDLTEKSEEEETQQEVLVQSPEEEFWEKVSGVWMNMNHYDEYPHFDFIRFENGTIVYGTMWGEFWGDPEEISQITKVGPDQFEIDGDSVVFARNINQKVKGEAELTLGDTRYIYMGSDLEEASETYLNLYE
ncbi:MAG: hypothetical protein IJC88_05805 [Oscillospiraceae bacterium]|nr:hypothetical protein [Oscillospiraceae bacterium]